MPKFRDMVAWQQAEQLMQPAYIRLIDNLRKALEVSTWKGRYEESLVWPDGTSDEVKARVTELNAALATAVGEEADAIEQALTQFPTPYPGHRLCLQYEERQLDVDLWDLCYQICFRNYGASHDLALAERSPDSQTVTIDTDLFDEDGEVDWNRLDSKAHQLVQQLFANLPEQTFPQTHTD